MVAWSVLTVTLLLFGMGVLVYVRTTRSLMQNLDATLEASSAAAQVELNETGEHGELERQGYRAGLFYIVFSSDGTLASNPQQLDLEQVSTDVWLGDAPRFVSTTINGDPVRTYSRRVDVPGEGELILVVGESLASADAANQELLLTLLTLGLFGVLLSFAGGWFLAARALVPIQRAFDRQQQFVADASHELRTPLTILHSSADLLVQRIDRPGVKNQAVVEEMQEEIVRMERLTRDLLDLARSDRGELRLAEGRVNLCALAQELITRVSLLAQDRRIRLEVQCEDAPPIIDADPDRLHEVGLIVLDNALKHTPAGGTVSITVGHRGSHGLLQVDDDGEGISDEHLARAFERFHRVDRSRSRQSGGAGLGLAIAHSLVAAHHGSISISRRESGGTRVSVLIPLAQPEKDVVHENIDMEFKSS